MPENMRKTLRRSCIACSEKTQHPLTAVITDVTHILPAQSVCVCVCLHTITQPRLIVNVTSKLLRRQTRDDATRKSTRAHHKHLHFVEFVHIQKNNKTVRGMFAQHSFFFYSSCLFGHTTWTKVSVSVFCGAASARPASQPFRNIHTHTAPC